MSNKDSSWSGVRVAVTGADGFIGSHLVEELVLRGANVSALAQYNSFDSVGWLDDLQPSIRNEIEVIRGDIRDAGQMTSFCRDRSVVFHLAALISIPFSYDAPSSYIQTNVQGTANVLSAVLAGGAEKVVNTSTSEVYGTALTTPISEDHPLQGQSPYSASKIGADMIASSYYRSFACPVVTLRPFNTFGPRQSERAVISTVIRQVLDDNCETIQLGDLTPYRDFNFVKDTVSAFLDVAKLDDQYLGQVFNVGSGRMVNIGEMVEMVRVITGCQKTVEQQDHRMRPAKSEVMTLLADASKLHGASGWESAVGLEDGLRQTVDWWSTRMNKVRVGAGYMV